MMRKYTPSILNHDFEHMFIEFVGRICSKLWLFTYDYPQIWLWTNTRIPWTWKQLVVILGSHPHKINVFHSSWFIFRGFSSGQCIEIFDLEPLKKWVNTCLPSPNPLDTWLCNQRACAESIDMHPIHAGTHACVYYIHLQSFTHTRTHTCTWLYMYLCIYVFIKDVAEAHEESSHKCDSRHIAP